MGGGGSSTSSTVDGPPAESAASRARNPIGAPSGSAGATSVPASAPPSALESWARPARSATIRRSSRTWSSGRSSRSNGSADPFAPDVGQVDVDHEQALVVERRREERGAGRGDDLGAAPERDRLLDADAVAEDDERGRELGVGPHQGPPRGGRPEPDLVGGGQVPAGRRRDVDEDLGAVEGQQLGHGQVPEVLADRDPDARAETRRDGPQQVARREETTLVEQAVGRQEELPVDVPDLAVLEQGRGDEQPVVGRFLDERHDRGQALGHTGELSEARIVEPHRDLGRQVLEQVAGQPELGEDDAGRHPPRARLRRAPRGGARGCRRAHPDAARSGPGRSGRSARRRA